MENIQYLIFVDGIINLSLNFMKGLFIFYMRKKDVSCLILVYLDMVLV